MAEYQILTIFAAFALAYSLIASRLEKTPINGALVYVLAGMLIGPDLLDLIDLSIEGETVSQLAEIALAICLFTDSSNANLTVLRRVEAIPVRLLLLGLPLTIALGMGIAWLIFGELGFFEVALIATMLAPTDAALGKAVVTNPVVPAKVRESLNVESGLNDGICVPVILFFIALAAGSVEASESASLVFQLPLKVIGIGLVTGLVLAVVGGFGLRTSAARGWVAGTWLQIPIIALALLCFGLAQWLGGSGFIAAFVGGLTFGALTKQHKEKFLTAAEGTADAVAMVTWFAFGTMALGILLSGFSWRILVYALLSLTVVRMLPVFLCLIGKGLKRDTLLFIGWFGPRGLASIVFVVMVIAEKLPGNDTIVAVVVWTIILSVLLHGLSANPLASLYGARADARGGEV
ncbi:cation:proton antiporter [Novipirellula artificiosorum]|uniref:K(+)/H(+) antiporter NhaP2 n=1 Tax=Novipirellula artificiosorum TaxID=2528016 RepID=A0A5C6DLI1_9BACT|nr:cation:proton antiporter [Novipirellula artificiosorum]TWU37462.1 K(+)/H(+) antiporter NhaP2 [Novipirellula artificiosorum]